MDNTSSYYPKYFKLSGHGRGPGSVFETFAVSSGPGASAFRCRPIVVESPRDLTNVCDSAQTNSAATTLALMAARV